MLLKYLNIDNNGEQITFGDPENFIYPGCKFEEGGDDGWRQGEDEYDRETCPPSARQPG